MPPRRMPSGRSWTALAASLLLATACTATVTPTPTQSPTLTAMASASATAAPSPGPISALPTGCAQDASGTATVPRVSIRDIEAQGYPNYDVVVFDFDRGLPEYAISRVDPPFTSDPSGKPLSVQGAAFFSIVFHGASIVDEELQSVYEGPTDFQPNLQRIKEVVLSGDFEAVSSWIVGLHTPACLAAQTFAGKRLVVAFIDAP